MDNLPVMETKSQSSSGLMKKVILPIFLVIILVELVFGIRNLIKPISVVSGITKLQPLTEGKIALVTSKSSFAVGESVDVSIRVSTGGHSSDGTDVYLTYDPTFLNAAGNASFQKGSVYSEYPIISVDNKTGTVRVSGIALPAQGGFSGNGVFGVMRFTAKKVGSTLVKINYQPAATTYSNIIETGTAKNLLNEGSSLNVTIGNQSVSQTQTACSSRVYSECKDSQGRFGSFWCSSINDPLSCNVGCFTDQTNNISSNCKVVNANK